MELRGEPSQEPLNSEARDGVYVERNERVVWRESWVLESIRLDDQLDLTTNKGERK